MESKLLSIQYEPTNLCNARCSYCSNPIMTRARGVMSDEVFEKIIKDCKEIKTLVFLSPHLLGEPTLDNKLYDRFLYIRKELPNIKIHLISNGTHLTKEIVQIVDYIEISLNYATKKEYEAETGLNFENTISKIYSLYNFRDKLIIHHVLSKNTVGHSEILKDMFKEFRVSVVPVLTTWIGKLSDLNVNGVGKRIQCHGVNTQLTILWNGDVVVCSNDYDGSSSSMIGNVKDKTLQELFNSDYLKQIRELGADSDFRGTFCENCSHNYSR